MSYTCRAAPERALMTCHLTGPVDVGEAIEMFQRMAADPDVGSNWGILLDAREREGLPSTQDVREFVSAVRALRTRLLGRIGFLANPTLPVLLIELAEEYAETQGIPMRGFATEAEAMAWLGLSVAPERRPATIVLIDDEPAVRSAARRILERAGHRVREASDGKEGVRLFREEPADMVITDLVMPEQEGIETIRVLRRDFPGLKILAMSGSVDFGPSGPLAMARHLGADAILEKPFTVEGLQEAAARLLASSGGSTRDVVCDGVLYSLEAGAPDRETGEARVRVSWDRGSVVVPWPAELGLEEFSEQEVCSWIREVKATKFGSKREGQG